MEKKSNMVVIGILLGVAIIAGSSIVYAEKLGFSIVLDPNVTVNQTFINNTYTGGLDPGEPYLYSNGTNMLINTTVLNTTIDSRIPSITESDPKWLANYTACNANQKLYFVGDDLACANDQKGWESCTDSDSCGYIRAAVSIPSANITSLDCAKLTGNATNLCTITPGAETDPYWTANQTNYYNKSDVIAINTSMRDYVNGNLTATNTSMKTYVDAQDDAQDSCAEITGCVVGAITSYTETDPKWTGNQSNYRNISVSDATYVNFTDYNYMNWDLAYSWGNHATAGYIKAAVNIPSNNITSIDCGKITGNVSDLCSITPGSGSGENYWSDGGVYLYPNASYGDNVRVLGWIESINWTNVTITKSQVSDFGSPLYSYTESDPLWYGNSSTVLNWNKTYADTLYLTSFTEQDPNWLGNFSGYHNTNWDTAYGWGDHSTAGYLKAAVVIPDANISSATIWNAKLSAVTALPWANVTKPSDCTAGQYATGIDGASLECSAPSSLGYLTYVTALPDANISSATAWNAKLSAVTALPDANVTDDLTITSTKMINTTGRIYSDRVCLNDDCTSYVDETGWYHTNSTYTWHGYTNATGYLVFEEI